MSHVYQLEVFRQELHCLSHNIHPVLTAPNRLVLLLVFDLISIIDNGHNGGNGSNVNTYDCHTKGGQKRNVAIMSFLLFQQKDL